MRNGFIIKVNSGLYSVFSNGDVFQCRARGKFRIGSLVPTCGDYVNFDEKENYLLEILPRKNCFIRPPIANVDQVVIVSSLRNPTISLTLINRFVTLSEIANIKPIIVLTKADLVEDSSEYNNLIQLFEGLHYDVHVISSKKGTGIEKFIQVLKGKKTVFTGQSGVGKSSLLNYLIPNLNQETKDISQALGRGKHITRIVEFIPYQNGWIADTPGFSLIEFNVSAVDLAVSFPGFENYYQQCKFRNCLHDQETGCAVKAAIANQQITQEHYDIYLSILKEIRQRKEKY